jgi:hypothetical protein
MWHLMRDAALAAVTAGTCSLCLLAVAQAGQTGAVHKKHLYRAPALDYLSGAAEAWMSGRCDGPYQSEFPPCIYPTFPTGSPYYYSGWCPPPSNDE